MNEPEKQEPVAWIVDGEIKVRLDMAGKLYYSETNVYAAPVHASDISQERVDETAKREHEPVAWFIQYEYRHEFLWREPTVYEKNSALEVKPLYAAPARPVVHAVRCTYPQCQATNGCVGACSKGQAEKQEPTAIGDEWKPCVKLPIVVHVREQRKGETHISTREGITPVKEDDLIMRGVAGEEYPIGRELFNQTYTFDTAPVHASGISQERVDETAKDPHELAGTIPISNGGIATSTPTDFFAPPKRKWVGLDDDIPGLGLVTEEFYNGMLCAEDILRKKNT